jgi:hypothetical protein
MPWKECSAMDERLQFVARRLRVGIWFCGSDRRRDSIDVKANDNPS